MIKIEVKGLDKLQKTLGESFDKLRKEINGAIEKSVLLIEREARINVDKMTRTHSGFLKNRWQKEFSQFRGMLYPLMNYAKYVHEGTAPHTIFPRFRKALYWRGALHPVKKVQHPGTTPRPFLANAIKNNIASIKKIFYEAIKRII